MYSEHGVRQRVQCHLGCLTVEGLNEVMPKGR